MRIVRGALSCDRTTQTALPKQTLTVSGSLIMSAMFIVLLLSIATTAVAIRNFPLSSFSSGTSGFRILGGTANAHTGQILNSAGDFNHDGITDLMVAAPNEPNSYNDVDAGVIYVLFGKAGISPFPTVQLSNFTTSATTGFKISGGNAGDLLATMAGLGDFNGDGIDDIAVSAQKADPQGRADAGTVYVIYGRTTGIADFDLYSFSSSGTNGLKIYGEFDSDVLGYRLTSLGDFNGDGRKDLFMSCQNEANPAAIAYVLFGTNTRTTSLSLPNMVANTEGFRITVTYGTTEIFTVGDVNNDGLDDIGISDYQATYSARSGCGIVYIIFGHSNATAFPDLDIGTISSGSGAVRILGAFNNAQIGYSGGAGGDFNNDGLHDLVVGDQYSVYVIFGQTGVTSYTHIDLADYFTTNTNAGQLIDVSTVGTPWYVGDTGDLDGDGITDIYISIPQYLSNRGVAVVVSGHASGFGDLSITDSSTTGLAWRVTGEAAGDYFGLGTAVTGADYNHDGAPDMLFGAAYADPSALSDGGAAYVLYGQVAPSAAPTAKPSALPSANPTPLPTVQPSAVPTATPTAAPTAFPTTVPTASPTAAPTAVPTAVPTAGPSATPTEVPTALPTAAPTAQPSAVPTVSTGQQSPTSQPSSQPSTQPSVNPATLQAILASPTYKVRNGFAFAALGAGGKVSTWGESQYGGDASAVQSQLTRNVSSVVGSRFAYGAVKADGALELWGVNISTAGLARYGTLSYTVTTLVANENAFAGVDSVAGRVIAVGSKHHGGDVLDDAYCNGYSAQLSAGVRSITASAGAFAAMKVDSTLLCWGNKHAGADVSVGVLSALVGAKMVVATMSAFAVLLSDSSVKTWGDHMAGGDSSAVAGQLTEVHHLTASRSCFVAFKKSSGVVVWGYGKHGGDTSAVAAALSSHVTQVSHTYTAMAALRTDGTVVAWGKTTDGGDLSAVQANLHSIVSLHGHSKAFAALTSTGGVVAWGRSAYGGAIPSDKVTALSSGVVSIAHTDRAFAALKGDGSVVVWGQAGHGGNPGAAVEALLTAGVHTICANDAAFSAIKTDGSVVAWGHSVSVPVAGVQFTSSSLAAGAHCA